MKNLKVHINQAKYRKFNQNQNCNQGDINQGNSNLKWNRKKKKKKWITNNRIHGNTYSNNHSKMWYMFHPLNRCESNTSKSFLVGFRRKSQIKQFWEIFSLISVNCSFSHSQFYPFFRYTPPLRELKSQFSRDILSGKKLLLKQSDVIRIE